MKGKLLTMPKSNAQLWSDLFNSFCRDIDKVAAHQKEQQVSVKADQKTALLTQAGNNQALSSQAQQSEALKLATEKHSAYRQAQEVVNLDDLGIGFGSDFIDPRDEEPWSDTQTRLEQMNSIKGR